VTDGAGVRAWQLAGRDLDISVFAPYRVTDPAFGKPLECLALVPDFGSPHGTLVVGRHTATAAVRLFAERAGHFLSLIDEDAYSSYERTLFVDTLNDWGWYGESDRQPVWYQPAPWTDGSE